MSRSLSDEYTELQELDRCRARATEMRSSGLKCLAAQRYPDEASSVDSAHLRATRSPAEAARVLRVLSRPDLRALKISPLHLKTARESCEECVKILKGNSKLKRVSDRTSVPTLAAALAVSSLATRIDEAPSAAFIYLYRMAFEVFYIGPPSFASGGARANRDAEPTAFVTNACIRGAFALLDLLHTIERSKSLLETSTTVTHEAVTGSTYEGNAIPEAWREVEQSRLELGAFIREHKLRSFYAGQLAYASLRPPASRDAASESKLGTKARTSSFTEQMSNALSTTIEGMESAISALTAFGEILTADAVADTQSADQSIALLLQLFESVTKRGQSESYLRVCSPDELEAHKRALNLMHEIRAAVLDFSKISELTKWIRTQVLARTEVFLRSVIDRETAEAAHHPRGECDAVELCFALAGYGAILAHDQTRYDPWSEPRLLHGVGAVLDLLAEDGHLPGRQAFGIKEKGYRLFPAGTDVISALTYVLKNIDRDVDSTVVRKMLRHFDGTRARGDGSARAAELLGWTPDEPEANGSAHWWSTALAIDALRSLELMLDAQINRRIYKHFSTRYPQSIDTSLDELFYPDYGLTAARVQVDGAVEAERNSLSHTLLDLCAHLSGVTVGTRERLWSAVFYGPPGTGKTTLLEALAKSANVPLVEVTPSDILSEGSDRVESRARLVFNALSMLTDSVILFDEFDSILFDRGPTQSVQPSNVFQFITPGMLPKLKNLHGCAKRRRTVYALATNYVESLDRAAVRAGRFDRKVGVFPPDLISRAGRLIDQYTKYARTALTHSELQRVAVALMETQGIPMSLAGKPSWFTSPSDNHEATGSIFSFIKTGASDFRGDKIEREDRSMPSPESGIVNGGYFFCKEVGRDKRYWAAEVQTVHALHAAEEEFADGLQAFPARLSASFARLIDELQAAARKAEAERDANRSHQRLKQETAIERSDSGT